MTDATTTGGIIKSLSAEQYSRFSSLLDEAIDLAASDRDAWLDAIQTTDPEIAEVVRTFFTSRDACEADGFLDAEGPLARELATLVPAEHGLVGKQWGPYRVLSLLGQGGMGSVWLAERADGLFARRVALKLVHPALMNRVMTERFGREREILASLSHPNIARLFDAGFSDDGQPYLALEYIAGTALTTYCDERRLSVPERLALFRQVLGAVQYAHAHLVIHRDLKPSNILVTDDGQVHLLDFGIAKLLTDGEAKATELTKLGGRAMTLDYAAPEQIAGAPITIAADVYSLGVMLYELMTGERPYQLKRGSAGALEDAILQTDATFPSRAALTETAAVARNTTGMKLSKALRGDLDTIVIKALKKLPAERYATANAFSEDIGRFLQGDVVLAQRDSAAYRIKKFTSRYRVAIAATGVLMLTLAGGLAATTYEARVASKQRDAALQAQLRSLTQTAAARLKDADVPGAMGIILEVLHDPGMQGSYTPEALSVFQEARAFDGQLLAMTGHADRVRSAAFSPDGGRIVTASYDKTARVWDAQVGRELMSLKGHTDRVTCAEFSPDGQRVVTASIDATARIWDAVTGREILKLRGHTERLTSAAFSPDGRTVVTASYDKTARIWDAATGRQINLLGGHAELVISAVYSPDGSRIATASADNTARLWDAATGRALMTFDGHTDRVSSVAFSSDGRLILTSSADKTARIWDASTGRQVMVLSGHSDRLTSAAFSPDGQRIVTSAYDKTARIWEAATGRQIKLLNGHTDFVESAVFSPNGRWIATASDDKTARIWDSATGPEIKVLSGHSQTVSTAVFSADARRILTASTDKSARVWDAATGRQIVLMTGHTGTVPSAAFSPDGGRIVTASFDKTARIWDSGTGKQLMILTGHADAVASAVFSPDGRRLATASLDKTARIWDPSSGRELKVLRGHTDFVETAAYSPDGLRIVTSSNDRSARIWDAAGGQQIMLLSGHTDQVVSAAFSPDGRRVVTASLDKTARIWDAASGRELRVLSGHTDAVEMAAFSPDSKRVATASADKTARIWYAASVQQLMVFSGHTDLVETALFSPDGAQAISGSDDKTVRVWDARAPALDVQIAWAGAAQFDPLSSTERFQLGLPASGGLRRWPADRSLCDDAAAAPYDPDRRAPGAMLDGIVTDLALGACANQKGTSGAARSLYQQGRADMANGDFAAAKADFEQALAARYRVAAIDLGLLLTASPGESRNVPRAVELYEQAWRDGVTIAAFELGDLYAHEPLLAADESRAWIWYQKGADAGEPNALVRLAERAESTGLDSLDDAAQDSQLLEAFKYYEAATDTARREVWPDEAWRNWRYRRASLARLLARHGLMQNVAKTVLAGKT